MIRSLQLGACFIISIMGLKLWAFDSLYPPSAFHVSFDNRSECLDHVATAMQDRDAALEQRYKSLDPLGPGIKTDNHSKLLIGDSDTAVLMMHGFSASPFEVENVARHLNLRNQHTVFSPLLEGYGSTASIANQHGYQDWRRGFAEDMALLSLCYDKVIVGGFSLGAALAVDYLLSPQHPQQKIVGALTLSPFFESSTAFFDFIQNVLGNFSDTYSFALMYRLSGNNDLKVILQYPQYYLTEFPLRASQQVLLLGKEIREKTSQRTVSFPHFLSYSQSDTIINQETLELIFKSRFMGRKQRLVYSKDLDIPHQVYRPEVNPYLNDLLEKIGQFALSTGPMFTEKNAISIEND